MKITKDMIHPDLYRKGKLLDFMPMRSEKDFRRISKITDILYRGKKSKKLNCKYFSICKKDGTPLRLCMYTPLESFDNLPCMFWIHGGGYVLGKPEGELKIYERFMEAAQCVIISPDYRLSVEAAFPAAAEDCYEALVWVKHHADNLHINSSQIFVGGGSAGGGLAVVMTLMARDRKDINIAFQMPLYPMLDNTMSTKSMIDNDSIGWNEAKSKIAWRMYVGDDYRSLQLSKYAAPAREVYYGNLPPAYSMIGTCDPLLDETMNYMENLKRAGVKTKLDIFKGGYHAFEMSNSKTKLGMQALKAQREAFIYAVNHCFAKQEDIEI